MKINEIKNLQQFDVIKKQNETSDYDPLDYSIYYVIDNIKSLGTVEVAQGYFDFNKKNIVLLAYTRKCITYDGLLLYYELLNKAGE